MSRFELLNNRQHQNLRMTHDEKTLPHFTPIVVSEFSSAAASCPIVFIKHPESGEFIAGAIFAFKPDEPPLKSQDERGGFEPIFFQSRGFFVTQESIAIDREDPRFREDMGDSLFTDTLQPAECLRKIQNALGALQVGQEKTREFIQVIMNHKLIEPINLSFQFDQGEPIRLRGLYTVSLDGLNQLDGETIASFFKAGYLELVYLMGFSLKQFSVLAYLRNERLKNLQ